jgi:hypothetical protein
MGKRKNIYISLHRVKENAKALNTYKKRKIERIEGRRHETGLFIEINI